MKGQRTEVPSELGLINSTAQRTACLELTSGNVFFSGPKLSCNYMVIVIMFYLNHGNHSISACWTGTFAFTFQNRFSLICLLSFEKPNQIKIPELIHRGGTFLQVLCSEGLEGGDQEELLVCSLEWCSHTKTQF